MSASEASGALPRVCHSLQGHACRACTYAMVSVLFAPRTAGGNAVVEGIDHCRCAHAWKTIGWSTKALVAASMTAVTWVPVTGCALAYAAMSKFDG